MITASITQQRSADEPSRIDGAHCACCAHELDHGAEGHSCDLRCENARAVL